MKPKGACMYDVSDKPARFWSDQAIMKDLFEVDLKRSSLPIPRPFLIKKSLVDLELFSVQRKSNFVKVILVQKHFPVFSVLFIFSLSTTKHLSRPLLAEAQQAQRKWHLDSVRFDVFFIISAIRQPSRELHKGFPATSIQKPPFPKHFDYLFIWTTFEEYVTDLEPFARLDSTNEGTPNTSRAKLAPVVMK